MAIRFFDMFAGIGGFRSGLEAAGGLNASASARSIRMPRKHTERCTIQKERCFTMMHERSIRMNCPISSFFAEDFPARAFQLLEDGVDLTTQEVHCSSKSLESLPLKDQSICCLKTFPDFYRMTKDGRLRRSSKRWMNWGMMSRGRCVTARISLSPSPGIACSLSDIIEEDAPAKYSLSMKQTRLLLSKCFPEHRESAFTTPTDLP